MTSIPDLIDFDTQDTPSIIQDTTNSKQNFISLFQSNINHTLTEEYLQCLDYANNNDIIILTSSPYDWDVIISSNQFKLIIPDKYPIKPPTLTLFTPQYTNNYNYHFSSYQPIQPGYWSPAKCDLLKLIQYMHQHDIPEHIIPDSHNYTHQQSTLLFTILQIPSQEIQQSHHQRFNYNNTRNKATVQDILKIQNKYNQTIADHISIITNILETNLNTDPDTYLILISNTHLLQHIHNYIKDYPDRYKQSPDYDNYNNITQILSLITTHDPSLVITYMHDLINSFVKYLFNMSAYDEILVKSLPVYELIQSQMTNLQMDNPISLTQELDTYTSILKPHAFDYTQLNMKTTLKNQPTDRKKWIQRIIAEITTLESPDHFNISFESSIFLRVDEDNPYQMKCLIMGSQNTPYDSDCILFDIIIPHDYPNKPPIINLKTKQKGPTIYDGRICLSILDSYSGSSPHDTERWNTMSSIDQIIFSIQAMVFSDRPYYNTSAISKDDKSNKEYNVSVWTTTITNITNIIINRAKDFYPFEDIVNAHLYLKRDYILDLHDKYYQQAVDLKLTSLKLTLEKITTKVHIAYDKMPIPNLLS